MPRCVLQAIPSGRLSLEPNTASQWPNGDADPLRVSALSRAGCLVFQYVDEEELMKAIQGFSSVTKEHTTFTDTQL